MSANPQVVQTTPTLKPGQAFLVGRIASRRKSKDGKTVFTHIQLPAPDEYSHPAFVEVASQAAIGVPGDEVRVMVRIGGSKRTFDGKDPGGEKVQVTTADNRLYVVE